MFHVCSRFSVAAFLEAMSVCSRCSVTSALPGLWWQDRWFCCAVCSHAAGDRTACTDRCGCTRYARMRRLLRDHRANMRIMEDLIDHHDLSSELDDLLIEHTGNTNFWLGEHEFMDEPSDAEDPEQTLRAANAALHMAAADQSTMVQAAQQALECGRMQADVEHARMALEDMRSGLLRLQD